MEPAHENRIARQTGLSAQLLAVATNAAGVGLWNWDVEGNVLTWDDQMYALYGIKPSDFTGAYEAWVAGLHPDDVEQAEGTTQQALSGEKDYDTEFRVVWPGGEVHWIRARATVIRDEFGKPLSMLGLNWDISAEKQMEAELAATAAREAKTAVRRDVEAAISELPVVLYGLGDQDTAQADRWLLGDSLRLVGVSKSAFEAGADLLSNVIPDDREDMVDVRAGGSGSVVQQFRVLGHDGAERWLQHVVRVDRDTGTETGALLDIDVTKRLSLRLNESEKMGALGRLAGSVAHDFNNILGVISNFASLVRDAVRADADVQSDIDQITTATERAGSITRQLLAVSRPPAGRRPTDANASVVGLSQFLSTAVGSAVELEVHPCDTPAMVLVDPADLDRVLVNLAVNARDAMPAGGRLVIGVSREAGQPGDPTPVVRITVSDTGVGMDAETVRHIFEPFFTTKEAARGAGLGLFTCFGIVTDAGGKIACSSVKGAGTTFTVDLPLLDNGTGDRVTDHGGRPPRQSATLTTKRPEPSTGHGAVPSAILILEDEPALRATTQRILEREGFVVTAVGTIAAAREVLAELDPDLVIADLGLADGNGMDFVSELRATRENLPVVISTGKPSLDAATQAIEQGVTEFLIKPVAPSDLIRAARSATVRGRQLKLRNRLATSQTGRDDFLSDLPATERAFESALSSLRVVFQPIVRADDNSVFGYEALLRCGEPVFAAPLRFIEAAEALGRIDELGLAVRGAVADVLSGCAPHSRTVFVNLHSSELRADLLGIAIEPLLPFASDVVLEITERAAVVNDQRLQSDLNLLRDRGYRIAIDDLGEGYAGLSNLARIKPDIVKIDMSLVSDIDRTPLKQDIVSAIIAMSRPSRILVLAEGVETLAERATLRKLGCDLLQGYLFGKPGPQFADPRRTFDQ